MTHKRIDTDFERLSLFDGAAGNLRKTAPPAMVTASFVLSMLAAVASPIAQAADADRPNHADALAKISSLLSAANPTSYGNNAYSSITNLKYENGYQRDANHYVVVATYTRVFKFSPKCISAMAAGKDGKADGPRFVTDLGLAFGYGEFQAGDSFDEARSYNFLRTEKGWILLGPEGNVTVGNRHANVGTVRSEPCPASEFPGFDSNTKMMIDYDFHARLGHCLIKANTPIKDRGPVRDPYRHPGEETDFISLPPGICADLQRDNNWSLPRRVLESTEAVQAIAALPAPVFPSTANAVTLTQVWLSGSCTIPKGVRVIAMPANPDADAPGTTVYSRFLIPRIAGCEQMQQQYKVSMGLVRMN
jgi:hypothetical protein